MNRPLIFTFVFLAGCASNFDPDLSTVGDTEGTGSTGMDATATASATGDAETTGDASTTADGSTTGDDSTTGTTSGADTGTTGDGTTTGDGSTDETGSTTGGDKPGPGEGCHFLYDQCEDGLTCVIYADPDMQDGLRQWGCAAYQGNGPGDFGEPCDDDYQCANGFKCAGAALLDEPAPLCDTSDGNVGCCTPYCESDDDCSGGLHCYYLTYKWADLHMSVQIHGWPRICVDDTWPQKDPPPP